MTISMFSTAQGTWSIVAPIPTAREWFGAATGFNGLIYAIGGDYDYRGIGGGTGFLTSVEAYDPIFNTWTEVAPLLSVQDDLAAAIGLDGKIYAMGGLDSSNLPVSTVESYDPATDS